MNGKKKMIKKIDSNIFNLKMDFDVSEIHKTTIKILEEIGIPLGSEKALSFLKDLGCNVDSKKKSCIYT